MPFDPVKFITGAFVAPTIPVTPKTTIKVPFIPGGGGGGGGASPGSGGGGGGASTVNPVVVSDKCCSSPLPGTILAILKNFVGIGCPEACPDACVANCDGGNFSGNQGSVVDGSPTMSVPNPNGTFNFNQDTSRVLFHVDGNVTLKTEFGDFVLTHEQLQAMLELLFYSVPRPATEEDLQRQKEDEEEDFKAEIRRKIRISAYPGIERHAPRKEPDPNARIP